MRKVVSSAAAAVLAVGITLGTAGAVVSYPSIGGQWDHGAGTAYVWSHYHHPSKTHISSVTGKTYVSSGWKGAGAWAYAETNVKLFGNKSNYNIL